MRLLFGLFAGVAAVLSFITALAVPVSVGARLEASAGVALHLVWVVVGLRWGHRRYLDPVPLLALFLIGHGLGVDSLFGLLFVTTWYRATAGDRVGLYVFAVGTYGVHALLYGPFDLPAVTLALALTVSTVLLDALTRVVIQQDERVALDEELTAIAAGLIAAVDEDAIYETARAGAHQLAGENDVTVSLWRGDETAVHIEAGDSRPGVDVPERIALDILPEDVRERLLTGRPFALVEGQLTEIRERVRYRVRTQMVFVTPITSQGAFAGAFAVGTVKDVGQERIAALGRLALTVGMALERAAGESLLRRSEERFALLAEHGQDGLYVQRRYPDIQFEFVNPALERLTGFSASEFAVDPDLPLRRVHPDEVGVLVEHRGVGRYLAERTNVRWRHADGDWRWHSVVEVPVHDDDGRVVAVQGLVIDVTSQQREQHMLERSLAAERGAADELRRLNDLKTGFLQAVSHELRTPLTSVIGHATTLQARGSQLDPEVAQLLRDAVVRNARRLERLLTDLLDVDRLARGVVEPQVAPTAVSSLVESVVGELRTNNHRVISRHDDVVAVIDGPKVERILDNLVRNAVKHTPAGTTIWVTVEHQGTDLVLVVDDDGPGISDDLKASAFEPFLQGPDSAFSPNPGTGIGLTLVQRFTELHGGQVWVEDRPDGGASFRVRIPHCIDT